MYLQPAFEYISVLLDFGLALFKNKSSHEITAKISPFGNNHRKSSERSWLLSASH